MRCMSGWRVAGLWFSSGAVRPSEGLAGQDLSDRVCDRIFHQNGNKNIRSVTCAMLHGAIGACAKRVHACPGMLCASVRGDRV